MEVRRKGLNRLKKEGKSCRLKIRIRELASSPSTSDPSKDDDIPPRDKKKRRSCHEKKNFKMWSLSTSSSYNEVWSVTSSGESKEKAGLSSLSSICKQREDRTSFLKALRSMQVSFVKAVDYRT